MIYQPVTANIALSQGDITDACPILVWNETADSTPPEPLEAALRVVVLTQACDLAQSKSGRVVVAIVHSAEELVSQGVLKVKAIIDQVRLHRV